ncbi:MAG: hypothetical protein NZ480_00835 [Bdellovibrionaceae bacterium]|nr:hypothetical protein [Pseudobdellovibrionaceae bacterium]MDW8189881.1 hypothetical protein [Pseudobdellovibrionaceae bacterium]
MKPYVFLLISWIIVTSSGAFASHTELMTVTQKSDSSTSLDKKDYWYHIYNRYTTEELLNHRKELLRMAYMLQNGSYMNQLSWKSFSISLINAIARGAEGYYLLLGLYNTLTSLKTKNVYQLDLGIKQILAAGAVFIGHSALFYERIQIPPVNLNTNDDQMLRERLIKTIRYQIMYIDHVLQNRGVRFSEKNSNPKP